MSRPPRCRSGIGGSTSHTRSPFYVQPALHPLAGAAHPPGHDRFPPRTLCGTHTDNGLIYTEIILFDKNGLHSVTAQGKFKMRLLLVLE